MDFSPDTLRARFHELSAQRAEVDVELSPLRAELDRIASGDCELSVSASRAREAEIRPRIVELQRRLAPIEAERAVCARALNGKTGVPA